MSEPWDDEPDRMESSHGDLICVAFRNPHLGHWCGYVGVPIGHPWHGKHYDNITPHPAVHGGLTYADDWWDDEPPTGDEGHWYVGFDCAHLGDLVPKIDAGRGRGRGTYRDLPYVQGEIVSLAKQAGEAA